MTAIMNDTPDASPDTSPQPLPPSPPAKKEEKEDSFPVFLLKLVLVVAIFRSFIFAPFNIPSESMLPRLENGDYLLAAKWPYGFSKYSLPFSLPLVPGRLLASQPERGDVVIFKAPPTNDVDYIKRVIGLPGDTVRVIDGTLYLNGRAVPKERVEDFVIPVSPNTKCARPKFQSEFEVADEAGKAVCSYPQYRETLPNGKTYNVLDFGQTVTYDPKDINADNTAATIVPEGYMFVMGDNRDNSLDSRFPATKGGGVGLVPQKNLVGKATIMMWSTDGSANWFLPWTWFTAARWNRIGGTF
ncbi:signal peptidase [Novosphingobium sp. AAP83]|nr:signal peptidase I [Novosphingobium sp. AAP83]KPF90988.1 signal peptidase [Novosphingobium sp. AAP83]